METGPSWDQRERSEEAPLGLWGRGVPWRVPRNPNCLFQIPRLSPPCAAGPWWDVRLPEGPQGPARRLRGTQRYTAPSELQLPALFSPWPAPRPRSGQEHRNPRSSSSQTNSLRVSRSPNDHEAERCGVCQRKVWMGNGRPAGGAQGGAVFSLSSPFTSAAVFRDTGPSRLQPRSIVRCSLSLTALSG